MESQVLFSAQSETGRRSRDQRPATDSSTRRVLADLEIVASLNDSGGVALARRNELIVARGAGRAVKAELRRIGSAAASLPDGTQLWSLHADADSPFLLADRLSSDRGATALVGPNHVFFPCPNLHGCPAGPPRPARGRADIPAPSGRPIGVAVVDCGTIDHPALADRVTSEQGTWFNSQTGRTEPVPADELDRDGDGLLDMMAGHGTFACSVIAERAASARITSIGHRSHHATMTEWEIANTVATVGAKYPVISMAVAGMTHRDRAPIGMSRALEMLSPDTAVVASAGNMNSTIPHWPGAFPRVICVGATDDTHAGTPTRTPWSNHGSWVDCCTGGVNVLGAHVHWVGGIEDDPTGHYVFEGWSTWSGTSFSAPKVSAAIVKLASERNISPRLAAEQLLGGAGGVEVRSSQEMGVELALS